MQKEGNEAHAFLSIHMTAKVGRKHLAEAMPKLNTTWVWCVCTSSLIFFKPARKTECAEDKLHLSYSLWRSFDCRPIRGDEPAERDGRSTASLDVQVIECLCGN